LNHVQCVESIEFSSFNPVPDNRKMAGDLFYLSVKTLENPGVEHCITVSVNGFYKNDSSELQLHACRVP
jgi:protein TIF31